MDSIVLVFCSFIKVFCTSMCFSVHQLSLAEPIVTVNFYDPRFLKVNIKEYAVVGDSQNLTIGCGVRNVPMDTNATVALRSNGTMLGGSSLQNGSSYWKVNLTLPAYINCDMLLRKDNLLMNVSGSDIKLYHVYNGSCLPNNTHGSYLLGEVIGITCIGEQFTKWVPVKGSLLSNDVHGRLSESTRFLSNYMTVQSKADVQKFKCNNTMKKTAICTVKSKSLHFENTANVIITPENFTIDSMKSVTFHCESNVPTELISWSVQTRYGDALNGYGNSTVNSNITHHLNYSELQFQGNESEIISVSCRTERAGRFTEAITYNIKNETEKLPDPANGTTNGLVVIIIIIIVLILFILSAAFNVYLILYKSKRQLKLSALADCCKREGSPSRNIEQTSGQLYATCVKSRGQEVDRSRVEMVVHEGSVRDQPVGNNLSTAILSEGALVITNDVYGITG